KQVPAGQSSAGSTQIARASSDRTAPVSDAAPGAPSDPFPDVKLSLLQGGSLSPSALRGKVTVINFWATWCVPCKSEIPMFNQFQKAYQARGVEIVGVSLDVQGIPKVKPFVKENAMNYTIAIGDDQTAAAFKIDPDKLPVTLIADKQGRIRYR